MIADLFEGNKIANLAESTQYSYLFEIERLAGHYKASPADLDADQLRAWVLRLIDRGLSPSSTNSPWPPSGSCMSRRWAAPGAWPGCAIARSPTCCRAT